MFERMGVNARGLAALLSIAICAVITTSAHARDVEPPKPTRGAGPGGTGACCLLGGGCVDVTADQCFLGVFQGPGTDCATAGCAPPPVVGACCLDDGTCFPFPEDACALFMGTFLGENSSCDDCPMGACCFGADCIVQTPGSCATQNGVYQGDGTVCDGPNICSGACCFADGSCMDDLKSSECTDMSGVSFTPGEGCADVTCVAIVGACCLTAGGCQEITEDECASLGEYKGDGTLCVDECLGACCTSGGGCTDGLDPDGCAALNGVFLEVGSVCDSTCMTVIGACCIPDGPGSLPAFCADQWTPSQCASVLGVYQGDGSICSDVQCNSACCFCDGTCQDLSVEDCATADGMSLDVVCVIIQTDNPCEQPEPCCLPDATCIDTAPWCCYAMGGEVVDAPCDAMPCPSGETACCINGFCQQLLESECVAQGGTPFAGEGIVNGSFEDGLNGWMVMDLNSPFFPIGSYPAGVTSGFDFFLTEPTNGAFVLATGFDGDGASSGFPISATQDIMVDAPVLQFDYRAAWNKTFGATQPRVFSVVVEQLPGDGGALLMDRAILFANPGRTVLDTGPLNALIDLSAYLGTEVRLSFEWTVPEDGTGPAWFQLDNVRLTGVPCEDVCCEFTITFEDLACLGPHGFCPPLENGQVIDDEFGFETVITSITGSGYNNGPAIYDTEADPPNVDDADLRTHPDGNCLILQQKHYPQQDPEGYFARPNDAAEGGLMTIHFTCDTRLLSVDLLDVCAVDDNGVMVTLYDSMGYTRTYHAPAGYTSNGDGGRAALDLATDAPQDSPATGVNATVVTDVDFDPDSVIEMSFDWDGSGAIDNLLLCLPGGICTGGCPE